MSAHKTSINLLNDDCLLRIFDFLQLEDKICLRRACKRWKRLLDHQLAKLKALRLGQFTSRGGYQQTSGLDLPCRQHSHPNHRQLTVAIFNQQLCQLPADAQTRCFSINRFDYLHRCLKFNSQNITMLSLGQLNISYRLMLMLSANLPHLEHIELISCASRVDEYKAQFGRLQQCKDQGPIVEGAKKGQSITNDTQKRNNTHLIPSLDSFNSQKYAAIFGSGEIPHATEVYNQHSNEETNSHERLLRQNFIRNCSLVTNYKTSEGYWSKLNHVLIRNCHQLSELSLCLLLALTSRTLTDLHVESNQRLTGEFLNYCGPNLQRLAIKYCPMMQFRFLDDLVKLKKVLNPAGHFRIANTDPSKEPTERRQQGQENIRPFTPQYVHMTQFNFSQTVYCHL